MEVGSFPPNAFGLHDMHGNMWEWCRHDRHSNYNGIPIVEGTIPYPDGRVYAEGGNWAESSDAQDKVSNQLIRGGSYISHAKNCRSASRAYTLPYMRSSDYGFRVVCVLPKV
jgi:formylglycine-generating enzyme required for sulfatase activity